MTHDRRQTVIIDTDEGRQIFAGTDLPSPFATITNVSAGPAIVRMAFGEGFGPGHVNWHTAVTMHRDDAKALLDLLAKSLGEA